MSDEHSLLSASSADRWTICPISVTAPSTNDTNRAAAEGTLLHAICEGVLTDGAYPAIGSKHSCEGYDFDFTEDMQRDCDAYVNYVRSLPWVGRYSVEGRVYYGRALATPRNLSFGTADCRGFTESADGRCLEVIDLKMGRKPVNPNNNPQAILYAAGVLEQQLEAGVLLPFHHKVRVTIFQPRISHKPFSWLTTVGFIEQRVLEMRVAAQAAVRFKQGTATAEDVQQFPELAGKHCGYCKRKLECGAFKRMAVEATPAPGQTVAWNEQLFKNRSLIRAYLDDLEKLAEDSALQGNVLPGTKLVDGRRGNAQLKVSEALVRATAKHLNIESQVVAVKEVWATPAKVRDAFKKVGMTAEQLAKFIEQPEGKPVLTDADDPRPARQTNAGNSFTGVAQA